MELVERNVFKETVVVEHVLELVGLPLEVHPQRLQMLLQGRQNDLAGHLAGTCGLVNPASSADLRRCVAEKCICLNKSQNKAPRALYLQ